MTYPQAYAKWFAYLIKHYPAPVAAAMAADFAPMAAPTWTKETTP